MFIFLFREINLPLFYQVCFMLTKRYDCITSDIFRNELFIYADSACYFDQRFYLRSNFEGFNK